MENNIESKKVNGENDSEGIDEIMFEELGKFERTKTEQFKETTEILNNFSKKVIEKFSSEDQNKIYDALMLMYTMHIYQEDRTDGTPYLIHTLGVAKKVLEMSTNPDKDLVISALLHDSVEDQSDKMSSLSKDKDIGNETETSLKVLEEIYGKKVSETISQLSNPDFNSILEKEGVTKDDPNYQKEKNKLYAEHVKEAIEDPDVLTVKLADFTQNALILSS